MNSQLVKKLSFTYHLVRSWYWWMRTVNYSSPLVLVLACMFSVSVTGFFRVKFEGGHIESKSVRDSFIGGEFSKIFVGLSYWLFVS